MPAAAVGIGLSIIGIAQAVFAQVAGNESSDDLLDAVNSSGDATMKGLAALTNEMQWETLVGRVSEQIDHIEHQFSLVRRFTPANTRSSAEAQEWAKAVLDWDTGIRSDMFTINRIMMGTEWLTQPIMKLFAGRIRSNAAANSVMQSQLQIATMFFRSFLGIQARAACTLASAYGIRPGASQSGVDDLLGPFRDLARTQNEYNKQYTRDLSPLFNPKISNTPRYSLFDDANYVNTNECLADDGQVVVGLQLYKGDEKQGNGNQICLRIDQAPLLPSGDVDCTKITAKSTEGNSGYFSIGEHKLVPYSDPDAPYIDLGLVTLDPGRVAIGAALYKKGNRMALKLKHVGLTLYTEGFNTRTKAQGWYTRSNDAKWTPCPTQVPAKDTHFGTFSSSRGNSQQDWGLQWFSPRWVQPSPEMASYVTGAQLCVDLEFPIISIALVTVFTPAPPLQSSALP